MGDNEACRDHKKPVTLWAKSVTPLHQTPKRALGTSLSKSPKKGSRLPLQRVPQDQIATTDVKQDIKAGPYTVQRLPPCQAPQNKTATMAKVNTEAGPSHSVITRILLVVAGNKDLLVLPPILREIFEELTLLFDNGDSTIREPDTSDEESKHHKLGWPDE